MPDPFGSSTQATYIYSIYATYTTTTGPGAATVTSPNGGESWQAGTTHNITWTQTALTGSVTIDFYKGGSYDSNIGTAAATAGTYSWPIPSSLAPGDDYEVRIHQGAVSDSSDNPFSIIAPSGSSTIGNTDVFGTTSTYGRRRAMPFTMSEDGTIQSISIYHDGGSGDMLLGVYDGARYLPIDLLLLHKRQ